MTPASRAYIVRRIVLLPFLLVGLSIVVFALIHLAPGDPALAFISEQAMDPELVEQVRRNLGLDKPLPVQYAVWASHVIRLDFGTAYTFNRTPVIDLVRERLGVTVQLQGLALLVALALAIPIGVISAQRRYSLFDHTTTVGVLLGLALPNFWIALLLQLLFAVKLGWLPAFGSGADAHGLQKVAHYVMPVTVLATTVLPIFVRFMRSSMLDVISQDYVRTARAKGLPERAVIYGHALRNALIPMVTVVGNQLAGLLSGSVIVEYIFGWPGLGSLAYESILRRDYPVILALTLLAGSFILIVNVLVDIVYALIDPRISFD
ncbi:ABC transporter permease [Thermomicrobiaceae bacterium CFH 74404]|uniref:ABC transporter permease n=1 Tax=Thermalbibacter longus TaxID=2951981 RepID=A0AA42BBT0_9BACT|nr:ABC transporter permease [Thermalbibacter longus]MCM8750105.1 ABC transporter permease [Thermalbibacter longus]